MRVLGSAPTECHRQHRMVMLMSAMIAVAVALVGSFSGVAHADSVGMASSVSAFSVQFGTPNGACSIQPEVGPTSVKITPSGACNQRVKFAAVVLRDGQLAAVSPIVTVGTSTSTAALSSYQVGDTVYAVVLVNGGHGWSWPLVIGHYQMTA